MFKAPVSILTAPSRLARLVILSMTAFAAFSIGITPAAAVGGPEVTSVSPSSGTACGGTTVVITGSGFTGVTDVLFATTTWGPTGTPVGSGKSATSFTFNSDTQVTAVTPSNPKGTATHVQVKVGSSYSIATPATGNDSYNYIQGKPVVTNIDPYAGAAAGGTSVNINGSCFDDGGTGTVKSVTFGGTPATSFSYSSPTLITAVTPSHTGGNVPVVVTIQEGTGAGETDTFNDQVTTGCPTSSPCTQFTYVSQPPVVNSLSPSNGPQVGGGTVTINGVGLSSVTSVAFGSATTSTITHISDTQISVTLPAKSTSDPTTNPVHVTVTNPGGTSSPTTGDLFTYTATVSSNTPASGLTAGGDSITVGGTGFFRTAGSVCQVSDVKFGGTSVLSISSCTATQLVVLNPPHTPGVVDVVVYVTPPGSVGSPTNVNDHFLYTSAVPTVTSVSPSRGPAGGGLPGGVTFVTVTGTGFLGTSAVHFGTQALAPADYSVVDDTHIHVTNAPAQGGDPATVDVTVTTPGGTSGTSTNDHYTFVAAPALTSISPGRGSTNGGTSVTINGSGFYGGTASCNIKDVRFGTVSATGPFSCADGQVVLTTPAHTAGTVDVSVFTDGGGSPVSNGTSDDFEFVAPPSVSGVAPNRGPMAGGNSITITGSGFFGNTTACDISKVAFSGGSEVDATGPFTCTNTQVTVTAPPDSAGVKDISVTTTGGNSPIVAADHYTYVAPATVTAVSPIAGPTTGGNTVTVTGTGFYGGTVSTCDVSGVTFGTGNPGTSFVCASNTSLTVHAPSGASGTVDVKVITSGGTSAVNSPNDHYRYQAPPTVDGLSSTSGAVAGGDTVTIFGSGFRGGLGTCNITEVDFGSAEAVTPSSCTDTSVLVTSPPSEDGANTVDIRVWTGNGGESALHPPLDYFTYVHGYNILTGAGGIYSFGDALYWGNLIDHHYPGPAIGLAETPDGQGYNILTTFGGIYSFGNAQYYGNLIDGGHPGHAGQFPSYPGPATALAYTPSGGGYVILNEGGGLYSFGDASGHYYGNLIDGGVPHQANFPANPGKAVSVAFSASGNGYWILADNGAIYSFGDADYYGNLIDHAYPGHATSLTRSADGAGYQILTSEGGIYSFGDAVGQYYGNLLDHGYPTPGVAFSETP